MSEKDALPGWPYFIAAIMAALAFQAGRALPGDDFEEDYAYNNFYMTNHNSKHRMGATSKGSMRGKYSLNLREEHEGLIGGIDGHDEEQL